MDLKNILSQMENKPEQGIAEVKENEGQAIVNTEEPEAVFSIVDEVLDEIKEEGNFHLIFSSIGGDDPLSGTKSPSLDDSIMAVGATHKEVSFGEASEGFSQEEMQILSDIVVVESNVGSLQTGVLEKLGDLNEAIKENSERKHEVELDKRNLEIKAAKLQTRLVEDKGNFDQVTLYLDGMISEKSLSESIKLNPKKFHDEYMTDDFELKGLRKKIEMLEKELDTLNMKGIQLQNEQAVAYKQEYSAVESRLSESASNLDKTISKIIDIEFGETIRLKGGKFHAFVKCECGVCSSHGLDSMPRVILGDEFKDMEARVYKDPTVSYNKFSKISSDGIESKAPYRLRPDPAKYRRIIIPGLTNSDNPMICAGCGKILVPPVDVIERMIHRGFLIDTYSLCLYKSAPNEYENYLNIKGVKYYPGVSTWGTTFNEFLYEPDSNEDIGDIVEDFRAVDRINKVSTIENLSESEKILFVKFAKAKAGEEVDVRTIREDIISHKKSLQITIKELLTSYRKIPTEGLAGEPAKLAKAKLKNKARKAINGLLRSKEFVEWCVINRITSYSLKQVLKDEMEVIKPIQDSVNEYSKAKLIDSILAPTLVKEDDKWIVTFKDMDTPHFRFVLTYRKHIEDYFNRIVESEADSGYLLNRINKVFESANKYKKGEVDTERAVEKAIKDLMEDMEFIISPIREKILEDYVTSYGVSSLTYENGNVPCWLKHELELVGLGEHYNVNSDVTYNIIYRKDSNEEKKNEEQISKVES